MIPTDKQKKEISGYLRKWQPKLFLHGWAFKTTYFHENEGEETAAVMMKTEYKTANIKINPRFWELGKEEREEVIVHELCHCVVQPLVQLANDAGEGHAVSGREVDHWKESVTQHLTNIITRNSL